MRRTIGIIRAEGASFGSQRWRAESAAVAEVRAELGSEMRAVLGRKRRGKQLVYDRQEVRKWASPPLMDTSTGARMR